MRFKQPLSLLLRPDFEKILNTVELLKEINQARQEINRGQGILHEKVIHSLKDRLNQVS